MADEILRLSSHENVRVVRDTPDELERGDTLHIPRRTPHKMWNADTEVATATWRTRPAGRTRDWLRLIHRLGGGDMRKSPVPALAKGVNQYSDVFQLVIRPKALQPIADLALRLLALGWR
jgi:hypothetical protein